jgi:hypothetical protein
MLAALGIGLSKTVGELDGAIKDISSFVSAHLDPTAHATLSTKSVILTWDSFHIDIFILH